MTSHPTQCLPGESRCEFFGTPKSRQFQERFRGFKPTPILTRYVLDVSGQSFFTGFFLKACSRSHRKNFMTSLVGFENDPQKKCMTKRRTFLEKYVVVDRYPNMCVLVKRTIVIYAL